MYTIQMVSTKLCSFKAAFLETALNYGNIEQSTHPKDRGGSEEPSIVRYLEKEWGIWQLEKGSFGDVGLRMRLATLVGKA